MATTTKGKTAQTKTGNRTKSGTSTKKSTASTETGTKKSQQTKAEDQPVKKSEGRVEDYRGLSQRIAGGEVVMPPVHLTGLARRKHVRATLREDHQTRIEERSSGAEVKFEKLAGSLFKFFRGTALLFYRDLAGTDANMPTVLVLGDVHPSNFGVMPNADNVPIFSVNDFDETIYAPFTWDLKRGALGFMVAAGEEGDQKRKTQRKIVRKFLEGYLEAMETYAEYHTEKADEFRMDNSPKVIQRLFKDAWNERADWLKDDYLDEHGKGFRSNDELTPISSRRDEFQKYVEKLVKSNGIEVPHRAGELKVKDVAVRHGQGTASLGLPRYYVLIEGPLKDASDDIIIEFKRARRSALEGLTPPTGFHAGDQGDRIAHGQRVQLAHGDVFYGAVTIDGISFMTRERAPFRDDIDLDDLSSKTWKSYAHVCGRALAQAHALSDDAGQVDYDVEPGIVEATQPRDLFISDIMQFAEEALERLQRDHAYFRADQKHGAFNNIDMVYR